MRALTSVDFDLQAPEPRRSSFNIVIGRGGGTAAAAVKMPHTIDPKKPVIVGCTSILCAAANNAMLLMKPRHALSCKMHPDLRDLKMRGKVHFRVEEIE